jgi:hypothetical protein
MASGTPVAAFDVSKHAEACAGQRAADHGRAAEALGSGGSRVVAAALAFFRLGGLDELQSLVQLAAAQVAPGKIANHLGAGLRYVQLDTALGQVHNRIIDPMRASAGVFHAGRFVALGVPPMAHTGLRSVTGW